MELASKTLCDAGLRLREAKSRLSLTRGVQQAISPGGGLPRGFTLVLGKFQIENGKRRRWRKAAAELSAAEASYGAALTDYRALLFGEAAASMAGIRTANAYTRLTMMRLLEERERSEAADRSEIAAALRTACPVRLADWRNVFAETEK